MTADQRIPLSGYKQVPGPRIESSVRKYWLDINQVMLPAGVQPVRMKSAEQILQSGETRGQLRSMRTRAKQSLLIQWINSRINPARSALTEFSLYGLSVTIRLTLRLKAF